MNEIESITPETKIGALLDHYPELEEILIEMAPAFKKLRNPILRKTIAKVATLRQVAQIGNVSLGIIINKLRATVGKKEDFRIGEESGLPFENGDHFPQDGAPPNWFDPLKIVKSLDARPIIESGQQPINQVMEELKELKTGEIYELITPFVPAPLIEMIEKKNFQVWSQQVEPEVVRTYFVI